MTDRDFARIQAAFPALTWHWHTPRQMRGEVAPVGCVCVVVDLYRAGTNVWYIARLMFRGGQVWQATDDDLTAALSAARAAVAALRDDLTAALTPPPSPDGR